MKITSTVFLAAKTLALSAFLSLGFVAVTAAAEGVTVSGRLVSQPSNQAILEFTVQNTIGKRILIWDAGMPWSKGRLGARMILLGIDNSSAPIVGNLGLESGVGYESIDAKQQMKRRLRLCDLFPNIERDRLETDLVLFWTQETVAYLGKGENEIFRGRDGGMIVIPRYPAKSISRAMTECHPN